MSERLANRRNLLALGAAVGTLAAFAAGCGGNSLKTSPATSSHPYKGNPNAYGSYPANWREAVVAKTKVPADAMDIIVGFEVPGSNDWHESKPIPSADASKILLRIGPGPVEFRVQAQGNKGSEAMNAAPPVIFEGPEPYSKAIQDPEVRVPSGWNPNN